MAHSRNETISCPFCDYRDPDPYYMAQHVEFQHPENGFSPLAAIEDAPAGPSTGRDENINLDDYDTPYSLTDDDDEDTKPRYHNVIREHTRNPSAKYFTTIERLALTYVECPAGCGATVNAMEIESHLDRHTAEELALEELSKYRQNRTDADDLDSTYVKIDKYADEDVLTDDDFEDLVPAKLAKNVRDRDGPRKGPMRDTAVQPKASSQKRHKKKKQDGSSGFGSILGKSELGPYANERRMPESLYRTLEQGAPRRYENKLNTDGTMRRVEVIQNEKKNLIPVIAQLCDQDPSVKRAFLVDDNVTHVFKLPNEGDFCGYRNIQMMISYIQDTRFTGSEYFPGRLPSIIRLQNMIEEAWDQGFNSNGRLETGGIKGTRKYIGTSEAQALCCSLGISCKPAITNGNEEQTATEQLFLEILQYFIKTPEASEDHKVTRTTLPPIYFQHPGHSMTIIGFEIRQNGDYNLLVFDPMNSTSPTLCRAVGKKLSCPSGLPTRLLDPHRRGESYLSMYSEFETLQLDLYPPNLSAFSG